MNEPMSPRDKTQADLHKALASAMGAPLLPLPKFTAQYLAEHLANALVPSWLHERKCETAGEEIAHVLLMVGLFPPDWIDAYRAEVLAEAELLPKTDVVAWLVKKAREFRSAGGRMRAAQADAIGALASKVDRGAVRPDNLRMLPATFFEPSRIYVSGTWQFRCEAITPSPGAGETRALGWKRSPIYGVHLWHAAALDPDDWEHGGWTDVTDTTTGDNT